MENQYILSICIPTYQRGKIVEECVTRILENTDERVQVVVSDDHSSDDTIFRLRQISDERLLVIKNEENMAVAYNSYQALWAGEGKYVMLISDEDDIVTENISLLLEQLENHPSLSAAVASGTLYRCDKIQKDQWFDSAIDFLFQHGFYLRYMSGMIFKRTVLHQNEEPLSKEEGAKRWNVYCFMYLMALAAFSGGILTTSLLIYRQARQCYTSDTTNFRKGRYYFTPEGRIEQLKTWLYDVESFPLHKSEKWIFSKKLCLDAVQMAMNSYEAEYQKNIQKEAKPAVFEDFLQQMQEMSLEQAVSEIAYITSEWQKKHGISVTETVQMACERFPHMVAAMTEREQQLLELYRKVKEQRVCL